MSNVTALTMQALVPQFIERIKTGDFLDAINTFFSDDIESIECFKDGNGRPKVQKGIEAIRKKNEWWGENQEVHSFEVGEPMIGETMFSVRYKLDATDKRANQRYQVEEIAVYTVENGKIIREEFFYDTAGMSEGECG